MQVSTMWLTNVLLGLFIATIVQSQTDVRLPPTIIKNPKRTNYYRDDHSFTLECEAYGIPEIKAYEWKKDGVDLNLNAPEITHGVGGSITVDPATSRNEGFYQCVAKNQYGVALSNTSYQQKAVLDFRGNQNVLSKTVTEGEPFHIEAQPFKSTPLPTFSWERAVDAVDKTPVPLALSPRLQIAENGDLYVAYATAEDTLGGKIYKCTAFNEILDRTSGGSYTNVTVIRVPGGPKPFAPVKAFSSVQETIAVEGRDFSLRCFFSGNPAPVIEWFVPGNSLPPGRFSKTEIDTKLTITNVQPSDQGDYVCLGRNDIGTNRTKLKVRVEAEPRFVKLSDSPHDTNITAEESITFNCNAYAKPEANIVWLRNGQPIDLNSPPKRFVISSNKKSLTIRSLCRDCEDRPESSQSDLGIIQCNASNVHGYAFAAGYVNVLRRTKVILSGEQEVSVDGNDDKEVKFECIAESDPITSVVPRWYKVDTKGDQLVYEEPPVVRVNAGELSIHVVPNKTRPWSDYHGTYYCVADNGYSNFSVTAKLSLKQYATPAQDSRTRNDWVIFVIVGAALAVCVIFLLIGLAIRFKCFGVSKPQDGKADAEIRPESEYDYVHYDTIGLTPVSFSDYATIDVQPDQSLGIDCETLTQPSSYMRLAPPSMAVESQYTALDQGNYLILRDGE